ncbi:MAG: hypothetical protein JNK05_15625 [Myxococcales bacterium]|nr:hypothetical protein [Myxococcales bacterium]
MRPLHLRLFAASSLLALAACSPSNNPPADASNDTGIVSDSMVADSGIVTDTGVTTDGAVTDTGVTDATAGDSGMPFIPPTPQNLNLAMMGHDRLFGVTYAPSGHFFAVGTLSDTTEATADHRTLVVKFLPTGQLDTSFGTGGFATHNMVVGTNGEVARGIVVQSSGKIVVAATVEAVGAMEARDRNIALARFNADGTIDNTFGTMGVVTLDLSVGAVNGTGFTADSMWGLTQDSMGRLIVTGLQRRMGNLDSDFATVRLDADGVRDNSFGTMGVHTLDLDNVDQTMRNATPLADGSIVVAGYYTLMSVVRPVLFKLTPAGALDRSFGTNGVYSEVVLNGITEAYAAALQGTSFITSGYGRGPAPENIDWLSLRINANGTRDSSYGTMGVGRFDFMGFNDNARSLAVLPDERVLLIGGGRTSESNSDGLVMMLTRNGALDSSFGTNGRRTFDFGGGSDFFWSVATSPSGSHAAIVGVKSVGTSGMGNDDAVLLLQPVR